MDWTTASEMFKNICFIENLWTNLLNEGKKECSNCLGKMLSGMMLK